MQNKTKYDNDPYTIRSSVFIHDYVAIVTYRYFWIVVFWVK